MLRRPGSPFADSSLEALARLTRSVREVRFRAGESIWRYGDPSDYLVLIVTGSVACVRPSGEVILRAGPGYPMGNLERFSGEPRWYSATAETDVLALHGDTEVFLDILEDHSDMARSFVSTMARNLVRLRGQMAAQGLRPAPLPGQPGSPFEGIAE
jgi:CRP-like cAMP-binding protein